MRAGDLREWASLGCRAVLEKKEHTVVTWHDGEREVLGFWAYSFILKNIRTITDWHSRLQRDKLQREAATWAAAGGEVSIVATRDEVTS